jgi:RNA polymerase sigma-70 factor (ECF subfamily)
MDGSSTLDDDRDECDHSTALFQRLQAGDRNAAVAIFDRYVSRLIALARSRISARLQARLDAEDIVQSALRSFFCQGADGRYAIERAGDLWRLLAAITIHKLQKRVEHHTAAKRGIRAEAAQAADGADDPLAAAMSKEPTPEAAVAIADELQAVMAGLSPQFRQVLEARLQGAAVEEIAATLGLSERSIRRKLEVLRIDLESRLLATASK